MITPRTASLRLPLPRPAHRIAACTDVDLGEPLIPAPHGRRCGCGCGDGPFVGFGPQLLWGSL